MKISTIKVLLLLGFLATLFSCGQSNKTNNRGNVSLVDMADGIDPELDFSDVFLTIVNTTKTDTSRIYIAKNLYEGKTVGLQIEVKSNLPNGITKGGEIAGNGFIRDAVTISSIGEESDAFIKALSELYDYPTTAGFTKQPITVTAFSLNQQPSNLDKPGYYKFKLFFEEADEEPYLYAELFLNINTVEQIIELHEKDMEYREPLIEILTKQ